MRLAVALESVSDWPEYDFNRVKRRGWATLMELLLDPKQPCYQTSDPETASEVWTSVITVFEEEGGFGVLSELISLQSFVDMSPEKV